MNNLTACWTCRVVSCPLGAVKLEVSNHGKFVILEVDGSDRLVVGMQSKQKKEVVSGDLRLAVGGILINKEHLIVQVACLNDLHCGTLEE